MCCSDYLIRRDSLPSCEECGSLTSLTIRFLWVCLSFLAKPQSVTEQAWPSPSNLRTSKRSLGSGTPQELTEILWGLHVSLTIAAAQPASSLFLSQMLLPIKTFAEVTISLSASPSWNQTVITKANTGS